MKPARPPEASLCPECGAEVRCGAALGEDDCWCADLPKVVPQATNGPATCLCEACLRQRIASEKPLRIVPKREEP